MKQRTAVILRAMLAGASLALVSAVEKADQAGFVDGGGVGGVSVGEISGELGEVAAVGFEGLDCQPSFERGVVEEALDVVVDHGVRSGESLRR